MGKCVRQQTLTFLPWLLVHLCSSLVYGWETWVWLASLRQKSVKALNYFIIFSMKEKCLYVMDARVTAQAVGLGAWISHAELENKVNLQLGMFIGWKELI